MLRAATLLRRAGAPAAALRPSSSLLLPTTPTTSSTTSSSGTRAVHSKRQVRRRFRGSPSQVRAAVAAQKAAAANPRPLVYTGEEADADLPFAVQRIALSNQLPVYTDYRNGRTKTVTILRKFTGDVDILADELKKVCRETEVKRYQGRLEAKGHHREEVVAWLEKLGF